MTEINAMLNRIDKIVALMETIGNFSVGSLALKLEVDGYANEVNSESMAEHMIDLVRHCLINNGDFYTVATTAMPTREDNINLFRNITKV